MASPPTSAASPQVPEAPVSKGWLRVVRIAAVICLASLPFLMLGLSVELFPFGLLLGGIFVWCVWRLFSRLSRAKFKEGLAGAIGAAGALLVFVAIVAPSLIEGTASHFWSGVKIVSGAGLASAALLAAAIKTYYTARREPGDGWTLAKGLILGALLFIIFALVPPPPVDGRTSNQASAVSSLRTINTSLATYISTYEGGYPPSLKALGPGPAADCNRAGLIDEVLASGKKSGYVFEYRPGPPTKSARAGCPAGAETYTVVARPAKYGEAGSKMSFFTDESGVIRSTTEDREATAADSPVGA